MALPGETEELLAELSEWYEYNYWTGELRWKKDKKGTKARAGNIATSVVGGRYLRIKFNYKSYKAHRICWAIWYGKWPEFTIEHNDGNGLNNRLVNLQDVRLAYNIRLGHKRRMRAVA